MLSPDSQEFWDSVLRSQLFVIQIMCYILSSIKIYNSEKIYTGNQKKVGMRMMTKLHEQRKYR